MTTNRSSSALAFCGVFMLALASLAWPQGGAVALVSALPLGGHRPYVKLTWHASPSRSRLMGYNVYRADAPKGKMRLLNATPLRHTRYQDRTVKRDRTYYYQVRAVAADGGLSKPSNEAEARIPNL